MTTKSRRLCFSIYRPIDPGNFEEISVSSNKAILKHQNIIIMGDLNIELKLRV